MRTLEQIGSEFFSAVDETLSDAVLGIHTQISLGDAEELLKLCNEINNTEDDLYNMANKLSELSDKLMDAGYFDKVVAYKSLSFRMETLIDKLTKFTFKSTLDYIDSKEKMELLNDLDEEFKRYIETKKEYNL
ncbi:hypothetical protein K0040_16130 [Terrisporobacter petrolearius]|uniref:hypothetical protein n=1 Tax=Terrisporobacter petrolearius TaxID=1460447 RepID=UPI001D169A41|nr:hypothetical protein [Terrisporobacter petrolearius]MCC3865790.1 hypothetical protein [Terrisporobacter petrolearius]